MRAVRQEPGESLGRLWSRIRACDADQVEALLGRRLGERRLEGLWIAQKSRLA
jgi:hypothetical protein